MGHTVLGCGGGEIAESVVGTRRSVEGSIKRLMVSSQIRLQKMKNQE